MDLKLIQDLVRLMEDAEVTELEIEDERSGVHVRLKRGAVLAEAPVLNLVPGSGAPAPAAAPPLESPRPARAEDDLREITSPMVGTFYRASSPDDEPFVTVGDAIESESVVCIIEAMKVMNEIKAEMAGEIVKVLVDNGDPVEFGQPLFLVK